MSFAEGKDGYNIMGMVSLIGIHSERAKKRKVNYRFGFGVQKAKGYPQGRYIAVLPAEIQQKAKLHAQDKVELCFDPDTKDALIRKHPDGWTLTRYKDSSTIRVTFPFYPEVGYPDIGRVKEPKDVRVTKDGIAFSLDY